MKTADIRIEEFDYPLPDERIAKHPLAQRDQCRLLVAQGPGWHPRTEVFASLPQLLPADTMLVYNDTRVINARLRFRKGDAGNGALIEVFCLEPEAPRDYAQCFASSGPVDWQCFVGNSKRWKQGDLHLDLGNGLVLTARRMEKRDNVSVVRLSWSDPSVTFAQVIERAGEIPVPPYLNRATEASDSSDYQTVFSRVDGSVAAPTAGLHFTPAVLEELDHRGIARRSLTLHVGAGTFQPVKADTIGDHAMHSEFISVDAALIRELADTPRHVVAVGTTSVRTLESLYHLGCLAAQGRPCREVPQWYPYTADHPGLSRHDAMQALLDSLDGADRLVASTRLMIAPGYTYRMIEGMVTNFHQPRSTLLLLVSALMGAMTRGAKSTILPLLTPHTASSATATLAYFSHTMIETIKGAIAQINPAEVVVDTPAGIGYLLNITLPTYTAIEKQKEVRLLVHEVIREDAYLLYGFLNEQERSLFRLLIGVSGIGANTARLMLSAIPAPELEQVIASGDERRIKTVKGIGLKTAQRVIVDLKDKIKVGTGATAAAGCASTTSDVYEEALAALVILGFPKAGAQKALDKLFAAEPGLTVEAAIKRAMPMI